MAIKTHLKRTALVSLLVITSTLPITLFPVLQAIIAGFLFDRWENARMWEGVERYIEENERNQWFSSVSIPGAPSMFEYLDENNAFLLPELRTQDWAAKLGLVQPLAQYGDYNTIPVDKFASFDGLAWDVTSPNEITQYWIYITTFAMPGIMPWDAAFERLLEYHNVHPVSNDTRFAFVKRYHAPFLCHIWQVEPPALVHLVVEHDREVNDENLDFEAYDVPFENLRPVAARVIDLGLQEPVSPLAPGVFPSEFEQLRSLTTNPEAYTIVDEFNDLEVFAKRFGQRFGKMANKKGSFLDMLTEADNWTTENLAKPLGLKDALQLFVNAVFNWTFACVRVLMMPWRSFLEVLIGILASFEDAEDVKVGNAESEPGSLDDFIAMMQQSFNEALEEMETQANETVDQSVI